MNHLNASVNVLAHRLPSFRFNHAKLFCLGLVLQLSARHDVFACCFGHRIHSVVWNPRAGLSGGERFIPQWPSAKHQNGGRRTELNMHSPAQPWCSPVQNLHLRLVIQRYESSDHFSALVLTSIRSKWICSGERFLKYYDSLIFDRLEACSTYWPFLRKTTISTAYLQLNTRTSAICVSSEYNTTEYNTTSVKHRLPRWHDLILFHRVFIMAGLQRCAK